MNNRMSVRVLAAGLAMLLSACGGSSGSDGAAGGGTGGGSGGGSSGSTVNADFHTLRTPPLAAGQFELLTLSTLPDAVTGGDVLVAIRGLAPDAAFSVTRNGADVTPAFARQDDGEIRGLVSGLVEGDNTLVASSGGRSATLVVRNHPITGPVISGPHQTPFACRTEENGLGAPLDANCSATPKFQWFYRSSRDQAFHELADPYAPYPSDVMTTTTSDRRAVPFVVRVESRTVNRGIARLAVLDDPAARGPDAPFAPNWNHRIFYVYGESCGVGYHQGRSAPAFVLGDLGNLQQVGGDNLLINVAGVGDRLSKGDVVVHNTLSAFGVHCNPFISIETAMMMKEHVIEQYGPVELMVGTNGSGAALQQYNAINNAPGLLSAGLPTATFADIASTAMTVSDCGLLQHYYANSSLDWDDRKKAAVNGHNLLSGNQLNAICQSWTDAFFDRLDPTTGCDVPGDQRYHPTERPNGVRCTVQDANVNWLGRDPQTGFARRPLDNVGIQYGLAAFNAGTISFEEFLDLNRNIGGLDIDGNFVPQRHAMDPEVAALLYRVGQVIGRGALAETPVMDLAPYLDLIPVANIHEAIRPFTIRARLLARGTGGSQSIWRGVLTQPDAYPVMEQWLEALRDMRPAHGGDHVQAVLASKPSAAGDRCVIGTVGGRLELPDQILGPLGVQAPLLPGLSPVAASVPLRIDVPENFDSPQSLGPCGLLLPVTRTPRMVAGMPLSDDIVKCQLKPVDPNDYAVALSESQLAQIREIFPGGVCDYSKPGVGDVEKSLIWPSVGGRTLQAPHELKWRVARSS
jgi:hypothetical protein